MMAIANDKGWLSYDEKVTTYWPEFAANGGGKENITVADIMRHEANMEVLCRAFSFEECFPENIKNNSIGKLIEESSCWIRPESNRTYHTFTKDMLANEVFRRVEPNGRTMGEYFAQEMKEQHGFDVYITMAENEYSKLYKSRPVGMMKQMNNGGKKKGEGKYLPLTMSEMGKMDEVVKKTYWPKWKENPMPANWPVDKKGNLKSGSPEVKEFEKLGDFDVSGWINGADTYNACKAEVCSAMCKASARGLAKLGVFMANKGSSGENTLLSENGVEAAHSEPTMDVELCGNPTNFTKGGL